MVRSNGLLKKNKAEGRGTRTDNDFAKNSQSDVQNPTPINETTTYLKS
ncbi:MAG: hypothetical protein [Microvirus sp.]|nr:MAG: hypothetical protein [Microvirus sp.]